MKSMRPILKHDTIFYPCGYLSKLLRKTVCVGLIFTGGFFIVRWLATHCTLAVDSNTLHCRSIQPCGFIWRYCPFGVDNHLAAAEEIPLPKQCLASNAAAFIEQRLR